MTVFSSLLLLLLPLLLDCFVLLEQSKPGASLSALPIISCQSETCIAFAGIQ